MEGGRNTSTLLSSIAERAKWCMRGWKSWAKMDCLRHRPPIQSPFRRKSLTKRCGPTAGALLPDYLALFHTHRFSFGCFLLHEHGGGEIFVPVATHEGIFILLVASEKVLILVCCRISPWVILF